MDPQTTVALIALLVFLFFVWVILKPRRKKGGKGKGGAGVGMPGIWADGGHSARDKSFDSGGGGDGGGD